MSFVKIVAFFTLLFVAKSSFGQSRLSEKCQTRNLFIKNLSFCLSEYDSQGNSNWREEVKGGYRTSFGLQIDPSCFDKSTLALPAQKKNLEDNVREAFVKILNCQRKYPEISSYISDWITQARRTVISCSTLNSHQLDASGSNISKTRMGIFSKTSILKTNIIFARDIYDDFTKDTADFSTIVHEIFHSTGANNLASHNEVERVFVDDKKLCEINVLDDRVEVLAGLCSEEGISKLKKGKSKADIFLFERMNRCGNARGCENLFTSSYSSSIIDTSLPSIPLSKKMAQSLCDKIYDNGFCQREVDLIKVNDLELERYFYSFPLYRKLMKEMSLKLESIRIKDDRIIPKDWLNSNPKESLDLKKISQSACYQSVFINSPRGDNALLFRQGKTFTFTSPEQILGKSLLVILSNHLNTDACSKDKATKNTIKKSISAMIKKYQGKLVSIASFVPRKVFNISNPSAAGVATNFDNIFSAAKRDLESALGPILTDRLIRFYKKYSPLSSSFSCQTSGLTLRASAKLAKKSLEKIKLLGTKSTCPK